MHSRSLLTLVAIYPSAALKLRPSVPTLKSGSGYCAFGHAAPRAGVDVSERRRVNQWSRTLVSSLEHPQDESLDPIYVYNNMTNHPSFLDYASKAFQLGSSSVLWLSPSPEHYGLG
ncbi:hypothetical protein SUGI_0591290 [Cryptomeria japonica]|nr:hypothetical protein SUGI_0591290 [Cryptomeria japonica]